MKVLLFVKVFMFVFVLLVFKMELLKLVESTSAFAFAAESINSLLMVVEFGSVV